MSQKGRKWDLSYHILHYTFMSFWCFFLTGEQVWVLNFKIPQKKIKKPTTETEHRGTGKWRIYKKPREAGIPLSNLREEWPNIERKEKAPTYGSAWSHPCQILIRLYWWGLSIKTQHVGKVHMVHITTLALIQAQLSHCEHNGPPRIFRISKLEM